MTDIIAKNGNQFIICHKSVKNQHLQHTVKSVYKGHSKEPENVAFMSSWPLYTGSNYMHYSLMGKMTLPFFDSDLL